MVHSYGISVLKERKTKKKNSKKASLGYLQFIIICSELLQIVGFVSMETRRFRATAHEVFKIQ